MARALSAVMNLKHFSKTSLPPTFARLARSAIDWASSASDSFRAPAVMVAERARRGLETLGDDVGPASFISDRTPVPPNMGGQMYLRNADLATLAEIRKPLKKFSEKSVGLPSVGVGLGVGAPAYLLSQHPDAVTAGLMGVGAAAMTSTAARTGLGLGLAKSAPYMAPALRSYLVEKYAPELREPSPWDIMLE